MKYRIVVLCRTKNEYGYATGKRNGKTVSNIVILIGLRFERHETQQYGNRIKIVFQSYISEYFDDIVSNDTQLKKRQMKIELKCQKFECLW